VYDKLGFDAGKLVKFNIRPFTPTGEHSEDTLQRQRTAEYLKHFFYGTALSAETDAYLSDDPFDDQGTKQENAYNRYFGGYETLAPWKDYSFPKGKLVIMYAVHIS
jgi:hypothetical protein